MKNLFKNLMLVAVAAMAFTACTEENNEVNAVAKKTVLTFTASIDNDGDETRSGFVGSTTDEDGLTKYQSAWDGGEKLAIYDMSTNNLLAETAIEKDGTLTVKFNGGYTPGFIHVCSPADAWNSPSTFTIPAEQTPRENSVDPAAHILKATQVSTVWSSFTMEHQAAYGKMTLKEVDFDIDRVVINLTGSNKALSYTLNADDVEENVFWFTTEAIDVTSFTVTAFDAEGNAAAKTADLVAAGKTLSFINGQVSKFSVSDLAKVEASEVPMFTYAKIEREYTKGQEYLLLFKNDEYILYADLYGEEAYLNNTIQLGTYYGGTGLPFIDLQHSTFNNKAMSSIEMEVGAKNGLYDIVFRNISYGGTSIPEIRYTGEIIGFDNPDPRVKLDTPDVTVGTSGNTFTASWKPVANAKDYTITFNGTTVTDDVTTVEYTDLEFSKTYEIVVVANPENDETHKMSDEARFKAKTEKDPYSTEPEPDGTEANPYVIESYTVEYILDTYPAFILETTTGQILKLVAYNNYVHGGEYQIYERGPWYPNDCDYNGGNVTWESSWVGTTIMVNEESFKFDYIKLWVDNSKWVWFTSDLIFEY